MTNKQVNLVLAALTVATASLDVTSFLRLGSVFASVMTSNLIFVSVAAVKANATLAKHRGVAIAGCVLGVALGSAVAARSGRESRLGTRRLNLLLTGDGVLVLGYPPTAPELVRAHLNINQQTIAALSKDKQIMVA
jgi:uncharacterized membrane protein YoaK (UPF0700 family)